MNTLNTSSEKSSDPVDLRIERRSFLKGLAATIVLPWMPSYAYSMGDKFADAALPPRRFVAVTFGNGVYEKDWWVRAGKSAMEFSSSLQPLAPFANDITALPGLRLFDDTRDEGASGHMYYFTNLLSGAIVTPNTVGAAITADQLMAAEVSKYTDIPSLALGTEPVKSGTIFGAPAVCASTISWRGATSPVPAEIYPQQAFDRLFNAKNREADKSVLDYVLGDLNRVSSKVNYADRQKLEEYTASVRELEQRISRTQSQVSAGEGWQPDLEEPTMARPDPGMPANTPEHIDLMNEILALALRMDKTRVATFVMAQDVTNRPYNFVEGVENNGLHGLSHHGSSKRSIEAFRRTNRWHTEQVAKLVGKLKRVKEDASGTLLDNTMLLFTATMNDGDRHDPTNLTPLLIGGRNCDITPGRVREYSIFEDRRICNLHLSLMQRMGVERNSFGNSFHPLDLSS